MSVSQCFDYANYIFSKFFGYSRSFAFPHEFLKECVNFSWEIKSLLGFGLGLN
jgi:hypothetical protein